MSKATILSALIAVGLAYHVGHVHGGDVARLEASRQVEVVVADYPYAAACSTMLEAAWEIQDVAPEDRLPHKD